MSRTTGTRTARLLGTLAVGGLAATLVLTGCGTQTAGGGGSLAPLTIGRWGSGTAAAMDSSKGGAGSGFTVDGDLPTGPATGPVGRFRGAPTVEAVVALAAALGLTAAPVAHDHGWVVEGAGGILRVRSDASGMWAFSRSTSPCAAYSVDVDTADGTTGVACAAGGSSPGSSPAAPTDREALDAATPVLAAAGLSSGARVLPAWGGPSRAVVVDPTVEGLPTVGLRTTVDVDTDGVVSALGWLGRATVDASYPIVSAAAGLDRLAALPRPLMAMDCPMRVDPPQGAPAVPVGSPVPDAPSPLASSSDALAPVPCGSPVPQVVTGARLGLLLSFEGRTPVLVPAWLYDVRGWDEPLPVIAVQEQYLADPEPVDGGSSSGAVPGSSGGTDPSPVTETPAPPPATDPGTDPSSGSGGAGTSAVEKAVLDVAGTSLTLVSWGGVCADYSGVVDETGTTVKVQVVGRSTLGPDEACIEIAKQIEVVVTLAAPLGDRTVVDATTGATVPVTRA